MHQASAAIGVATANMLPQLTLTGSVGDESLLWSSLFQGSSGVWSIASGLTQPIFEGGTLRAKRRAAVDLYDQASGAIPPGGAERISERRGYTHGARQ